jgi:DNA invertase Pin-like site-specific DNA recombinase
VPDANRLTIHILAAVAEHEREMISERTKAGLGAARARGVKPGNRELTDANKAAAAARDASIPVSKLAACLLFRRTKRLLERRMVFAFSEHSTIRITATFLFLFQDLTITKV